MTYYIIGVQDFQRAYKILFAVHLKHSSFCPSAGVKPVVNDLVHAMPWQCMFALSMCMLQSLCVQCMRMELDTSNLLG
jgi:hypothetical protein